MSLSLTRRIARAALLIAAGAAPVVGAAGAAGAATLPATPNLGGMTALDSAGLGAVGGTAHQATGLTGGATAGAKTVKKAVPTASGAVAKVGRTATPLGGAGLPTDQLPVKNLPLGK
ncbi:ATP-binding protein [Streptomyces sp. NBC_00344]|uniref:ATP-binding protein n=1 Tax=Streptomyces sp. NBC_00344 TaxID=2975720 RepID=UPI002E22D778